MSSLNSFLASAKANRAKAQLLVVGNEAADLDSMVSSLSYAYIRHLSDGSVPVLPVLTIPRADFSLRPEAMYVFGLAGINLDELVFLDEICLSELFAGNPGLALVDHNEPFGVFAPYRGHVVAIVDHHLDTGFGADIPLRCIQEVGSTASLVAREFHRAGAAITPEVATLLTGAILLDTVNLAPGALRVTSIDTDAVTRLLPFCPVAQAPFFAGMQAARNAIAGLSSLDLLRRDYKWFQTGGNRCGLASIPISLGQWLEHDPNCYGECVDYFKAQHLDLLVLMITFGQSNFQRELVLLSSTDGLVDRLLPILQEHGLDLHLKDQFTGGTCGHIEGRVYHQVNSTISRKILQPVLAQFFAT